MTLEDLRDAWCKLKGNIQPLLLKMNARKNSQVFGVRFKYLDRSNRGK